jgi:Holliday junction resolvasome RuvABC endonuclease subunit
VALGDGIIVALDLSTVSTGVAIGNPGNSSALMCTTIAPKSKDSTERAFAIAEAVAEMCRECSKLGPVVLAIEELHSIRNMKTTRVLAMLLGMVMQSTHGIVQSVVMVHQATAKSAVGAGSFAQAGKEAVQAAVSARGHAFKNADEADAVAVWYGARGKL